MSKTSAPSSSPQRQPETDPSVSIQQELRANSQDYAALDAETYQRDSALQSLAIAFWNSALHQPEAMRTKSTLIKLEGAMQRRELYMHHEAPHVMQNRNKTRF